MAITDVTSTGGRGRVLVVDDDAALAEMLTHRAAQRGFRLARVPGRATGPSRTSVTTVPTWCCST